MMAVSTMKFLLELSCLVHIIVVNSLLTSEQCSFSKTSHFDPTETQYINIPNECSGGKIQWQYPIGCMHIRLSIPNASFNFCIRKRSGALEEQVIDFTGGTRRLLRPSLSDGAICSTSMNGNMYLSVEALQDMVYMTSFNYTVTLK